MEWNFVRRLIAFTYTLVLLMFIGIGFGYSNETTGEYRENSVYFSEYWKSDGKLITFPYSHHEKFTLTNTLPQVYGDQMLVLRCYYDYYKVYINGEQILENRDHKLFGVKTEVGQKEIWIPLSPDYTDAEVAIELKLQDSLYGSEVTEGFITTRSGYGIMQMKKNVPSMILYIVFTVTGIIEICIAGFFIVKRANLIRKLTFEALFYAGCFSIISAQWIICETRIPFIIFGYMTGFSVLTIISFLLMPLMFFELSRAIFLRVNRVDNIIDLVFAMTVLLSCVAALRGIIDWGHIVYIAHALDVLVMIIVGYYSYASVKEEHKVTSRTGIAIANGLFLLVAGFALVQYIDNIHSNYILLIIIDMMIYIMAQVGLIYRRIGLNVKEEREFAQAKIFAFTDELTKLGNRRHFTGVIEDYEKHKLPQDLTYIAIDVNRLKYYNDNIGHDAGDELLVGTAECLRRAFHNSSTAIMSRMGGDEFAVLVIASEAEIKRRLNNFSFFLASWKGKYVDSISVAIGYARYRDFPFYSIDDLAKVADEKMYTDKNKYYEETGYERRSSN